MPGPESATETLSQIASGGAAASSALTRRSAALGSGGGSRPALISTLIDGVSVEG